MSAEAARKDLHSPNFISGHFPVGVHNFLQHNFNYIAMIRDPVEREISGINFDYQRGYIEAEDAEFYLMNTMLDNPQTRIIAGEKAMYGPCSEEAYQQALTNLDKLFLFAAPHSAAFEVMQTLGNFYQSGPFAIAKAQVTGIKLIEQPSSDLAERLRTKHCFDTKLAQHVKTQWDRWKDDHVLGTVAAQPDDTLLCIGPDFAATKTPVLLKRSDVEQHNARTADGLVESSQHHTEIDKACNFSFSPAPPTA